MTNEKLGQKGVEIETTQMTEKPTTKKCLRSFFVMFLPLWEKLVSPTKAFRLVQKNIPQIERNSIVTLMFCLQGRSDKHNLLSTSCIAVGQSLTVLSLATKSVHPLPELIQADK